VAAAAGVQLAADVAEFLDEGAFDVRVDVFEFDGEGEVAALDAAGDLVEGGDDLVRLVGGEEADLGEHVGEGRAGADVVAVEPAVETDRLGERLDAVISLAAEPAAPCFLAHKRTNHRDTEDTEKTENREKREKAELHDVAFDSLFHDRHVEVDHQA